MAERRQRILYEVRKLVNEEGLEGFSMREISKRANVAPKTLYNAFGDRDRLIGCAIREVYDAVRQNVQFRTSDRTLEGLLDRAIVLNRGNLKERNYAQARSEEHTSELQSLMRTSYAVFCLKKKKKKRKI